MRAQLAIHWPTASALWSLAPREDSLSAELADGHYSRQTPGADGFLAPGQCIVLYHRGPRGAATWGVVHNVFREVWRWRNTIFANRSGTLSSTLVEAATLVTYAEWRRIYGALPALPLTTEIDIVATAARRSKRHEPGHCYRVAGRIEKRRAPPPARSTGDGRARGAA